MKKNKMRVIILQELKSEIISAYDLALTTKAQKKEKEFIQEINHLYSKDIIIPVYQNNELYFMSK